MQMHGSPKSVSIGIRIVSFLWDYLLIFCYIVLLIGVSYLAKPLLAPLFTGNPYLAEFTGFLLITLPVFLYFAICEGSKLHATWGKRKMGIIVVRVHGQPIGWGRALSRTALKFIPWELAHFTIWHMVIPSGFADAVNIGLLVLVYGMVFLNGLRALLSKKKQTVYDFIAGTVVISQTGKK